MKVLKLLTNEYFIKSSFFYYKDQIKGIVEDFPEHIKNILVSCWSLSLSMVFCLGVPLALILALVTLPISYLIRGVAWCIRENRGEYIIDLKEGLIIDREDVATRYDFYGKKQRHGG